ncbi:cold-shock protein [Bacteroidota bacterium]
MSDRENGTVKWFNSSKGYGFIERGNGGDLFAHYSSINREGFRTLRRGQQVTYVVGESDKGPQAFEIEIVE